MNLFDLAIYAFEHKDQLEAAGADFAKAGAAITAGVTLACSILAPWLKPQPEKPAYEKLRKIVNLAGQNYKHAKNAT